jgi:ABC-type uncharacterized transport system permease subunit
VNAQKGMAITEYVVVSMCVVGAVAGMFGIPVSEGQTTTQLMAEAFFSYLSSVTLSLSIP